MYRISAALIDLAAACVFLIPAFLLYGKFVFRDKRQTAVQFLFACYLAAVLSLVGFPSVTNLTPDISVNLIPFSGIGADPSGALLNMLLFVPMGVFLPVLADSFHPFLRALLFALCATVLIEAMQLLTFRATDVNDVLTNTAGAALGYGFARLATGGFRRFVMHGKPSHLYLTCATAVIVMFLMQPFTASLFWNGIL